MKKNRITLIAAILFSTLLRAQEKNLLTYSQFLEATLKNNPLSKRANNIKESGYQVWQSARGNYDASVKSDIENKFFNDKNYYTVSKTEIKQPLFTSQYLKAGYEYGQGNFLNPQNTTPEYGLPYLGLEVSLLQGLLFDKRRAEVVKGKYYYQYFTAEQQIELNDLLHDGAQAYFNLLYSQKALKLNSFFTSLARERLQGIQDLANAGEKPAIDTVESSIFFQGRILDQQSSQIEFIKSKNELLYFCLQPVDEKSTEFSTADSIETYFTSAIKLFTSLQTHDTIQNPFIKQYQAKQGIFDTDVKLKKEMIKPKLDVSYNFLSSQQGYYPNNFSTNNYKYGASLSFPLLLRHPRREFKIAKLNAANNQLDLQNKQNQIFYKKKALAENAKLVLAQVVNAQKSADFSKKLVEAERLKFTNGESSLFILNSRENKWLETELKLAEYKLKFIKLTLQLIHLHGTLDYRMAG